MAELYIGTAGWSYKDWVGSFYPKAQSAKFDWLKFYSAWFNAVEVNSTYYRYLEPGIFKGWLRKVEDMEDFVFTIKLHQDFTHKRQFATEHVRAVSYNLDILKEGERFGGLLIQFPYSFACTGPAMDYVAGVASAFEGYEKFIEIRHSSWQRREALRFLAHNNLSLCAIDQPSIGKAVEFRPVITGDSAYIRFHGRNEEAWRSSLGNYGKKQTYEQQNERYKYLYSPGELAEIETVIREVYDKVKKVFVIMNNHPTGYAVANSFELLHLLRDRGKVDIPETTLKTFPRLVKIAANG